VWNSKNVEAEQSVESEEAEAKQRHSGRHQQTGMAYRLHRISQSVRVRPSVGASTWLRVSAMDLASQVLALSLSNNAHDHTSFRLHQVSAISRKWTLAPLHAPAAAAAGDEVIIAASRDENGGGDDDVAHGQQTAETKPRRRRRSSVKKAADADGGSAPEHYRVEPGQTKTFFLRILPRDDHDSNDHRVGTHLTFVHSQPRRCAVVCRRVLCVARLTRSSGSGRMTRRRSTIASSPTTASLAWSAIGTWLPSCRWAT
jgi:hypothetical protein